MESAGDALTALCRSHPSQELAGLSSELTSIAKRTEAVAQCCVKTKSSLQDGLQLHFNGTKWECFPYFEFVPFINTTQVTVAPSLQRAKQNNLKALSIPQSPSQIVHIYMMEYNLLTKVVVADLALIILHLFQEHTLSAHDNQHSTHTHTHTVW